MGCGPGTNAHLFAGMDYTGIDINERYVAYAAERHPGKFIAADATQFEVPPKSGSTSSSSTASSITSMTMTSAGSSITSGA